MKTETETEEKICKYIYCDNIIGENKRKDAKFCCPQHKQDNNKYLHKIENRIRSSVYSRLRDRCENLGDNHKIKNFVDILGMSYSSLIDYLNDNKYGFKYGDKGLDIDHIIPISKATTREEAYKLSHYTNLHLIPRKYNNLIKLNNEWNEKEFEDWYYYGKKPLKPKRNIEKRVVDLTPEEGERLNEIRKKWFS